MFMKYRFSVSLSSVAPMMLSATIASHAANPAVATSPAEAAAPAAAQQPPSASPSPIPLPKAYQSIIISAGALSTSGASALKTYRADLRSEIIRSAVTAQLLSLSGKTEFSLDKANSSPTLSEQALLCDIRKGYTRQIAGLNYINTLVGKLSAMSNPAPAPTDILGALKLLFATSSYSISGLTQNDSQINLLTAKDLAACKADLGSYDKDYYGMAIDGTPPVESAEESAEEGLPSFGFLGPVGTLFDTFLSIVTPIFINASTIADEERRREVLETALRNPKTKLSIEKNGKQLAIQVDTFANSSRHKLAGAFVEELVSIREMNIDLSKAPECQNNVVSKPRLPSGAPSAAFVSCWQLAWSQVQPRVVTLNAIADSYDTLADAGNVNARSSFGTILADYDLISANSDDAQDAEDLNVFWSDVTKFVSFANAIATAASTKNISTIRTDLKAVDK